MSQWENKMHQTKQAELKRIIRNMERVAIAYSGGVDSSYLLAVCLDELGQDGVLAVTVDSPLMPRSELANAKKLAAELQAPHLVFYRDDLADPQVAANPADRCYYCKRGRFLALQELAAERGFERLLHGENLDDADDYRPGTRAAHELAIRAPLAEAGLSKAEIRDLSRKRNLFTWELPARACLASRFPYGTPLTAEGLARVEAAERFLEQQFDLRQFRVRDHHPLARLEVEPPEIARLAEPATRGRIVAHLRQLGYLYVTLDLNGYRMGSMNDVLDPQ